MVKLGIRYSCYTKQQEQGVGKMQSFKCESKGHINNGILGISKDQALFVPLLFPSVRYVAHYHCLTVQDTITAAIFSCG